jgi:hypothetical protein
MTKDEWYGCNIIPILTGMDRFMLEVKLLYLEKVGELRAEEHKKLSFVGRGMMTRCISEKGKA